jgi:hypothetical protein
LQAHAYVSVLAGLCTDDRLDVARPSPAGLEFPSTDLALTQSDAIDVPVRELAHCLGLIEALSLKRHEQRLTESIQIGSRPLVTGWLGRSAQPSTFTRLTSCCSSSRHGSSPAHRWSEQMMDATVQLTRRISGEVMRRKANSLHWIEQMLRHHDVRSKRVLNLVKSRADSLGSPAQHWPTCGGEKSIPGKGAEAVVELEGAVRAADRL